MHSDNILRPRSNKRPWRRTPLILSPTLSRAAGCQILLKLESLQPSGSFKSRGIGNLIWNEHLRYTAQQSPQHDVDLGNSVVNGAYDYGNQRAEPHFFCSSGGNAGLACAVAAAGLGHECTICVPTSTEESMVARLRAAGASQVLVHGDNWSVADQWLREEVMPAIAAKSVPKGGSEGEQQSDEASRKVGVKAVYVPPFDHDDVRKGNSSIVDELVEQMQDFRYPEDEGDLRPTAVVCSVGGGGLFSGIVEGVERHDWHRSGHQHATGEQEATKIIAVETLGADSLSQSLAAGRLVTLPGITSIAKSLGAVRVAEATFEDGQKPFCSSVVIPDIEAAWASVRIADDERILLEAGCAASVSLVYGWEGRLEKALGRKVHENDKVVVIVCGGSRVSLQLLEEWKRAYGHEAKQRGLDGVSGREKEVPSTFTTVNRQ